ncbi:unnamed protein product [Ranitomeya imitator]|uniref:Ras-GAP domain-containing protein n=1 Tax=Ranitomeya imitator TaxID=111125 RepID=A0ABN9L912_9NEOB|nr:unnamed protein product [Ranitomeya imitator]
MERSRERGEERERRQMLSIAGLQRAFGRPPALSVVTCSLFRRHSMFSTDIQQRAHTNHVTAPSDLSVTAEDGAAPERGKVVSQRFPQNSIGAVGSAMFLRFINPAIVSPYEAGILDKKPPPRIERGLKLMSKGQGEWYFSPGGGFASRGYYRSDWLLKVTFTCNQSNRNISPVKIGEILQSIHGRCCNIIGHGWRPRSSTATDLLSSVLSSVLSSAPLRPPVRSPRGPIPPPHTYRAPVSLPVSIRLLHGRHHLPKWQVHAQCAHRIYRPADSFQILQSIANHVLFTKEEHMRPFNDFVKSNFDAARRSPILVNMVTSSISWYAWPHPYSVPGMIDWPHPLADMIDWSHSVPDMINWLHPIPVAVSCSSASSCLMLVSSAWQEHYALLTSRAQLPEYSPGVRVSAHVTAGSSRKSPADTAPYWNGYSPLSAMNCPELRFLVQKKQQGNQERVNMALGYIHTLRILLRIRRGFDRCGSAAVSHEFTEQ